MSETINVICDNCGAKPKRDGDHAGWVTTKPRPSSVIANVTVGYFTTAGAVSVRTELDLCPQCVEQIRKAKQNGYPNAPERVS